MTKTGTVTFSAPEIFTQKIYDEKIDIWSAGIVLHMMLCGQVPFQQEDLTKLMYSIINDSPRLENTLLEISYNALDLIKQMLEKDPKLRPSA